MHWSITIVDDLSIPKVSKKCKWLSIIYKSIVIQPNWTLFIWSMMISTGASGINNWYMVSWSIRTKSEQNFHMAMIHIYQQVPIYKGREKDGQLESFVYREIKQDGCTTTQKARAAHVHNKTMHWIIDSFAWLSLIVGLSSKPFVLAWILSRLSNWMMQLVPRLSHNAEQSNVHIILINKQRSRHVMTHHESFNIQHDA